MFMLTPPPPDTEGAERRDTDDGPAPGGRRTSRKCGYGFVPVPPELTVWIADWKCYTEVKESKI